MAASDQDSQNRHLDHARLWQLLERAPLPLLLTQGGDKRVVLLNRQFRQCIGYGVDEIPDAGHWWPLAYPEAEERERLAALWRQRLEQAARGQGEVEPLEAPIRCKDGETRIFLVHAVCHGDLTLSLFVELTALRQAQSQLAESHRTYRALFERSADGILLLDGERFIDCNAAAAELLDYPDRQQLLQRHPAEISPPRQPDGRASWELAVEWIQRVREVGSCRFEWVHLTRTGKPTWLEVQLTMIPIEGREVVHTVWRDINERIQAREELEYRASHDALTGLYNRDRMQQLLREADALHRRHGFRYALILLDIDHFKSVNDRFGHAVGDSVLQTMGNRIHERLRETDRLGRWGGEEFLILAPETTQQGALELAERIRQHIESHEFDDAGRVTASFGVAASQSGLSLDTLMVRADRAMYAAKCQGRNRVTAEQGSSASAS
ncbi:sensor domain-containing diguanylate cyclase [Billgrantia gudaonensis]|uniref:diguanylate cyclase n=1 Tax=Billgrantia gudaonensis TaxID=376427 RepID=A0A1G8U3Z2_9GAMM|nr:diguanylate cyclase [Halomonas gudaonensis]SDJ47805.1 PAS domain S-box-containing protein/diguanylate cyclase (GGDEF) domain-containing protein [Halomonas gudaonensis]